MNCVNAVRGEHHYWPTCPCDECLAVRDHRRMHSSKQSHHKSISLDQARRLGFLSKPNPYGSLAAQIVAEGPEILSRSG